MFESNKLFMGNNKPKIGKLIIGGDTIIWGKSAEANEYVTFDLSNKGDWWFHAHGVPGSHVILITENNYNKKDVQKLESWNKAIEIASTKCKNTPKSVTWCEVHKVTKTKDMPLGKVNVINGYKHKIK